MLDLQLEIFSNEHFKLIYLIKQQNDYILCSSHLSESYFSDINAIYFIWSKAWQERSDRALSASPGTWD